MSPVPVSSSLSMLTLSPAQLVSARATAAPTVNAPKTISLFMPPIEARRVCLIVSPRFSS